MNTRLEIQYEIYIIDRWEYASNDSLWELCRIDEAPEGMRVIEYVGF